MNGFLLKMRDCRGFKFSKAVFHTGASYSLLGRHTLHFWLCNIQEGLQEYVTLLSISQQTVALWDITYWGFIALNMYRPALISHGSL